MCTTPPNNGSVNYKEAVGYRFNYHYIIIYKNILDNLATGLIPLLSLAWFNYEVYKGLIQRTINLTISKYDTYSILPGA